jgi:hypothetical protein
MSPDGPREPASVVLTQHPDQHDAFAMAADAEVPIREHHAIQQGLVSEKIADGNLSEHGVELTDAVDRRQRAAAGAAAPVWTPPSRRRPEPLMDMEHVSVVTPRIFRDWRRSFLPFSCGERP